MAKENKSILYLLPLIRDWSISADLPLNCYSITNFDGGIVCEYPKGEHIRVHPNGVIVEENEESIFILYFIKDRFMDDYKLIMNGRYSKIDDICKKIILSRSPTEIDYEFLENILYKSKKYKRLIEKELSLDDLDKLTSEYDSIFNDQEVWKMKENSL